MSEYRWLSRGPDGAEAAAGWSLSRVTRPGRLSGANGLRQGPDGRLWVAQVSGSQISAIDVDTGAIETVSGIDGGIVAPDDLVFDEAGNLYATEITLGQVSVRSANGQTRVIQGDMPCANPITWHQGRLIAGECRVGGRIMELDLNGGAPRTILADVPMPNAMAVGPDGLLYLPIMGTNEIWRVNLNGGQPEVIATDLGVPDAIKFDAKGRIITTQVVSGQVIRLDPVTGQREVLAQLAPGLDNVEIIGDRIFVSSILGTVVEIQSDGTVRDLVPESFNWPHGICVMTDGTCYVADGPFTFRVHPDGSREIVWFLFDANCPGYTRGIADAGEGLLWVSTANGHVAKVNPNALHSDFVAEGLDRAYGIAGCGEGAVVAEGGTGRVLHVSASGIEVIADGLDEPRGVAVSGDQAVFISELGSGQIRSIRGGRVEILVDGLDRPEGLAVTSDHLYVLETGAGQCLQVDLASGRRSVIATGLPIGTPSGCDARFLRGIDGMSGPMGPFAGLAIDPSGSLLIAGNAEGSVLRLSPLD